MEQSDALRFNDYTITGIIQTGPGDHLAGMSCQLSKDIKSVYNTLSPYFLGSRELRPIEVKVPGKRQKATRIWMVLAGKLTIAVLW